MRRRARHQVLPVCWCPKGSQQGKGCHYHPHESRESGTQVQEKFAAREGSGAVFQSSPVTPMPPITVWQPARALPGQPGGCSTCSAPLPALPQPPSWLGWAPHSAWEGGQIPLPTLSVSFLVTSWCDSCCTRPPPRLRCPICTTTSSPQHRASGLRCHFPSLLAVPVLMRLQLHCRGPGSSVPATAEVTLPGGLRVAENQSTGILARSGRLVQLLV